MANTKLLEIFHSFSPEEREEFTLFLKSPFFVRGGTEEMLRYFNCLSNGNQDTIRNKINIHENVYPEKPFSEARLERATTRLYQYTEQFLMTQYYQRPTNSQQQLLDLVGVYKARNLVSLYEKQLSRLKKAAHENTMESSKNYLFKYQVSLEEYNLKSYSNNGKNDLAISDLIENLSLFYYTEQTERLNCFLLQQKTGIPKMT
ncbi:MAG: hypothetical protein IPH31_20375 [Lewinellaceae bacterium]|nr:hypothetical protein [Lewinellaceae bacterium]